MQLKVLYNLRCKVTEFVQSYNVILYSSAYFGNFRVVENVGQLLCHLHAIKAYKEAFATTVELEQRHLICYSCRKGGAGLGVKADDALLSKVLASLSERLRGVYHVNLSCKLHSL